MQSTALDHAKRYTETLAEFRTQYTSKVVATAKANGLKVTHDYSTPEMIGKAIPLPATLSMELGNAIAKKGSGGQTKLYSAFPFDYPNRISLAERDQFARDAWSNLNENPEDAFYRFEDFEGRPALRYAIADRMRESCVKCHNTHPDTPRAGWKVGDVRGVLEVTFPLDVATNQTQRDLSESIFWVGGVASIGLLVVGLVVGRLRRMPNELQLAVNRRTSDLAAATVELKREVKQREHAQAELTRANKVVSQRAEELKLADQAKSAFLANMSHEIRTPMNAVMGLTELVLKSELDDIQRDYLSTVMDSSESLLSIINDIPDFSKIEAGKLQFDEVEFRLHDTVGDAVRTQALRAERKDLELACFVDPAIPEALLGDPGRVRQVLLNLIGNAIKFTESGEVVVRVEPASNENGRVLLDFMVSDTGVGIDPKKLGRIFEPFEQADMSTTREYGGTGLGLAICHKLVALMGGEITVDSEAGRGSTFRFTAAFAVSERANEPAPVPTELKGTRVLVVDDNATNREILEQILLAKEMAPVTAPSALDGFTLLQDAVRDARPFRLLISDMHMPKMDGFGFVELIRADNSLAGLDIIVLTSAGKPGDQSRCEKLRIAAQLTKPAKQSELYNVVIRTLGLDQPDAEDGWMSVQSAATGELPPLRILLVEDSIPNQKVALAVLAGPGHTTVVANHGQEALDILKKQQFDVILMDVKMPVMDGLETTAAIRAAEDGVFDQHQPIVAMTAHAMSGDRERCLEAGMDEYVSKPVRQEALSQAIAIAIGHQHASGLASGILQTGPSEKLVDWTDPLSLLGGDHSVVKEITQSYINETADNMARLPAAIVEGNAADSTRLAHTVKGAMRFFRAETATQLGQELEELCGTGDLTAAPELFARYKSEVDRVLPVLQRFVETGEM